MKNQRNMKEEIKVKVDTNNIHKTAINDRIYKYTWSRYINILNEERLIKDILESCKKNDEEIIRKYSKELEKIQIEKETILSEINEVDEEIEK